MRINTHCLIYKFLYYVLPLASLALFMALWNRVSSTENSSLPSPIDVFNRLIISFKAPVAKSTMFQHIYISLGRVFGALIIAVIAGIPFGIFLGWNRTFRALFKPLFEMIRPVPAIAWVPLITVWFGIGEFPRMLIVFLGVFMPIVVNSYSGVLMIPPINIDAGKIFGANKRQLLFDIAIPSSLSAIFAGIRTALSVGWMVLLAAEMISAKSGLGFLIVRGSSSSDIALAIVAMIFIGIGGAIFAYGFDFFERWICPWKTR